MNEFLAYRKKAIREWERLQDPSQPVIYIGMGSCGLASGAGEIWDKTHEILAQKKIKASVLKVGCIGPCYLEPFLDIHKPGEARVSYNNVDGKKLEKLLPAYLQNGKVKIRPIGHLAENGQAPEGVKSLWDQPMLKGQERLVLRNCGIVDPEKISHYIGRGGFGGLIRAFKLDSQSVIGEVKTAGLRGRGGAGFPTWRKCSCAMMPPEGRNT